jgi:hypothetical protein
VRADELGETGEPVEEAEQRVELDGIGPIRQEPEPCGEKGGGSERRVDETIGTAQILSSTRSPTFASTRAGPRST